MSKVVSNFLLILSQFLIGIIFLIVMFLGNKPKNYDVMMVKNHNLFKSSKVVSVMFVNENVLVNDIETYSVDNKIENNSELVDTNDNQEKKSDLILESFDESLNISLDDIQVNDSDEEKDESFLKNENDNSEMSENVSLDEEILSVAVPDVNGYSSNSSLGFNVTTNNKIYSLSDEDFNLVASKVQCESHSNKDDILAVISVILNRSDKCYGGKCDPVSVAYAPSQFVCKAATPNSNVISVVKDALNGVRNNSYLSFRSWGSSSYSDNYIAYGGNRYK